MSVSEYHLQIFPTLLNGELRFPNLEREGFQQQLSTDALLRLLLRDGAQTLDLTTQIRDLATNGAIKLARSLLDDPIYTRPRLTGTAIQELVQYIEDQREPWGADADRSIDAAQQLAQKSQLINPAVQQQALHLVERAIQARNDDRFDLSWELAESALALLKHEHDLLQRQQAQAQTEGNLLVTMVEAEFTAARSTLDPGVVEPRIMRLLTEARRHLLESTIDFERIEQLCQAVRELVAGRTLSDTAYNALIYPETGASSAKNAPQPGANPKRSMPEWYDSELLPTKASLRLDTDIEQYLRTASTGDLRAHLSDVLTVRGLMSDPNSQNNENRQALFSNAQRLFHRRQYEEAYNAFLELNRNVPINQQRSLTTSPAYYNAAACALGMGKPAEVVAMLHNNRKQLFGFPLWHLAVAYFQLNRLDDAIVALLQWIDHSERQQYPAIAGRYAVGLLLRLVHQPDMACAMIARVHHSDSVYVRSKLALAQPAAPSAVGDEYAARAHEQLLKHLQPRPPERYTQFSALPAAQQSQIGQALELVGEDKPAEALERLREIEAGGVFVAPISWAIGSCQLLLDQGYEEEAVERLTRGSEEMLNLPGGVYWNHAVGCIRIHDIKRARQSMKRCTDKEFKASPRAWLVRGLLSYLAGERNDARSSLQRSAMSSEQARTTAVAALELIGDQQLLQSVAEVLGTAQASTEVKIDTEQEPSTALEEFQRAVMNARRARRDDHSRRASIFIDIAPEKLSDVLETRQVTFDVILHAQVPTTAPGGAATDYFVEGVRCYRDQRFVESANLFQRFSTNTQDPYYGHVNRGVALLQAGRLNEALAALEHATTLSNGAHVRLAWWNLAVARRKRGDLQGAIEALLNGRRYSDPTRDPLLLINLAHIADTLDDQSVVADALYDACRFSPNPSVSLRCYTIKICRSQRDWERVTALLNFFIDNQPLREVLAGSTRPRETAEECRTLADMEANLLRFQKGNDSRSATDFFRRVESLRTDEVKRNEAAQPDERESAVYAMIFRGFASRAHKQDLAAAECYIRALNDLTRWRDEVGDLFYAEVCERLAREEVKTYPVFAHSVAQRGLAVLTDNGQEQLKQRLRNHSTQAGQSIPKGWLNGEPISLAEASTHAPDNEGATVREAAQRAHDLLTFLRSTLSDFKGILSRAVDLAKDISDRIEQFEEASPALRNTHHAEITKKLRLLDALIQMEFPLRFKPVSEEVLTLLNRALERLAASIPAIELGPQQTLAHYRGDQLTVSALLENQGHQALYNLDLRLQPRNRLHQILQQNATERVDVLPSYGRRWVEWKLSLDPGMALEMRDIELRVEVTLPAPDATNERVRETFDLLRMPEVFDDITVARPVGALTPDTVNRLWGRSQLLQTMRRTIMQGGQSQIYFLEGVRKVGKTSIMYFLAEELKNDSLWAYINFDTSWSNIYERISQGLRESIRKQGWSDLSFTDAHTAHEFSNLITSLLARSGKSRLLLLFDEFGSATRQLAAHEDGRAFLGDLRYLLSHFQGKVAVVMADFRLLSELQKTLPGQIWADVERQKVNFLDFASARDAIRGPIEVDERINLLYEVSERIFRYTSGYPWHLQQLCSGLIERLNERCRYEVFVQDVDEQAQALIDEDPLFLEGLCRLDRLEQADGYILGSLAKQTSSEALDTRLVDDDARSDWVEVRNVLAEVSATLGRNELEARDRLRYLAEIGVIQVERNERIRFSSVLLALWAKKQEQSGRLYTLYSPATHATLAKPSSAAIVSVAPIPVDATLSGLSRGLRYQQTDITSEDISTWVAQFATEDWRAHALSLLSMCKERYYYDETSVRERIDVLFRQALGNLQTNPPFEGLSVDDIVDEHLWLMQRNPRSQHETALIQLVRSECSIPKRRILTDWYELYRNTRHRPDETIVLIVDEFVGTGDTLASQLRTVLANVRLQAEENGEAPELVEAWIAKVGIVGLIVVGSEAGLAYVADQLVDDCRLTLYVSDQLTDADRAFTAASTFWLSPDIRGEAQRMAEEIGRSLSPAEPLGRGGGGYLVAFYHMVPSNTVPLLHRRGRFRGEEWKPLFARRAKLL